MKKKLTIVCMGIFLLLFNCHKEYPTTFSKEALADTFIALDGKTVTFQNILAKFQGKTVIIDVWASWCRDCIKGIPKIKKLQTAHPDVVFVFLSLDKTTDSWKNGIRKYEIDGSHFYMKSGWGGPFGKFLDLDWIPRYLHKGVVLWMNVAWNRNFYGKTNIQVVLRDESGIVLESRVLTTEVSRKTSNALRKRMLRLERAREIGEMDIPITS